MACNPMRFKQSDWEAVFKHELQNAVWNVSAEDRLITLNDFSYVKSFHKSDAARFSELSPSYSGAVRP